MRATSAATLPLPITTARSRRQVELELAVVRVAVVPGDELGGGPASGQVLARDPERLVGLGAGRVDHGVVVAASAPACEMSTPTSTFPKKRQPRPSVSRSNVSSSRLISWWSGATPPRRSPQGVGSRSKRSISTSPRAPQQAVGRERPGGPGADDRDAAGPASGGRPLRGALLGEELGVHARARRRTSRAPRSRRRSRRPGTPRRRRRSRCRPPGRCRAARPSRSPARPGFGWMQSTGQTSMHESSLMQLPAIT